MPNLMNEFSFVLKKSQTFSTLRELQEDTKTVQSTIMGGAQTTRDRVIRFKQSRGFRGFFEWFQQKNDFGTHSSFDDTDEFDAGFHFGDDESQSTESLDGSSMQEIAASQVREMFHIGEKQLELKLHTTSEIINTIDKRSAEVIASLKTTYSTTERLSAQLDRLISIYSNENERIRREQARSIFDNSGRLTLRSLFSQILNPSNIKSNLTDAILSKTKLDRFDRSVNDKIRNAQFQMFTKALQLPFMKFLIGDATRRTANEDYTTYIENQYTKEHAVFDKITRKTIVDVIPEYLKKITEVATGVAYNVSSMGALTTDEPVDKFYNTIDVSFRTSNFSEKHINAITAESKRVDAKINQSDIRILQQMMVSQYVYYLYQSKRNTLSSSLFEYGGVEPVNVHIAQVLSECTNQPFSYWHELIIVVTTRMMTNASFRESFTRTVNEAFHAMDKEAKKVASNSDPSKNLKFTQEMFDRRAKQRMLGRGKYAEFDGMTLRELLRRNIVKRNQLTQEQLQNLDKKIDGFKGASLVEKSAYDTIGPTLINRDDLKFQYVSSIFDLLNRGINVYRVSKKQRRRESTQGTLVRQKPMTQQQTITDAPPTPKQPSPVQKIEEKQTVGEKISGAAKKTVNAVLGGPSKIISSVKGAISKELSNVQSDVMSVVSNVSGRVGTTVDTEILKYKMENVDPDDGDAKKDASVVKGILSSMEAATVDGSTQDDQAALASKMSDIKDPETRERVSRIVSGTLQRSQEKAKPKSMLGKAILLVLTAGKTFFSKTFNAAKTFLLKGVGFIGKSLKSSVQMITRGSKNVKEGIFGVREKKDKDGNVIREGQNGLIKDIREAWSNNKEDIYAGIIDSVDENVSNIRRGVKAVTTPVKNILSAGESYLNLKRAERGEFRTIREEFAENREKWKETGQNLKNAASNYAEIAKDKISRTVSPIVDKVGAVGKKVESGFINVAGTAIGGIQIAKDRFLESDFGKGFMKAFQKDSDKPKIEATSLFDKAVDMSATLIKTDWKDTVLDCFVSALELIQEEVEKYKAKQEGAVVTEENDNDDDKKKDEEEKKVDTKRQKTETNRVEPKKKPSISKPKSVYSDSDSDSGGLGFNLGKTLGGITSILGGIGKAVLTVVASMEGFQALMSIGETILKKSLAPLNKVFQSFIKMIKPIVTIVQKILKQMVEVITEIVIDLVNTIQPIFEALVPLIESILDTLTPILELITDVVKVVMVPLTALLKVVVIPILRGISNTLEILLGIVQVGMGIIMTGTGGLLVAIGTIVKWLSGNDSVRETGEQVFSMGTNLVKSGAQSVVSGMKKNLTLVGDTIKDVLTGDSGNQDTSTEKKKTQKIDTTLNGSPMDGLYGSGDESPYGFNDEIKNAFSGLRSITNKIVGVFTSDDENDISNGAFAALKKLGSRLTGMFTGEEDESVDDMLKKESKQQSAEQLNIDSAALTDEERESIEQTAWANFQKDFSPREGETMEEYKKRYESGYKSQYVSEATKAYLSEKIRKTVDGEDDGVISLTNKAGDFTNEFSESMFKQADQIQAGQFGDMMREWASKRNNGGSSGGDYYVSALTKDDLIRSAAEIFEAYQKTNPNLTYSNGLWADEITTRSGHTRKIRPDCSGTMSAAIQELGYTLKDTAGKVIGDNGLRSGDWGTQSSNTLIYDSPTATTPSADWTVLDYSQSSLQPGDITAYPPPPGKASGHVSMPIVDLQSTPRGLDGGSGIGKSPAAAVAYLNGETDIPWTVNAGMRNMKKIWRFLGRKEIRRSGGSGKTGVDRVLTAASELFLAAKEAQDRNNGPFGHGAIIKNITFNDGMVIDQMSAMCTGTQAAIVKRMGYYLPSGGKAYSSSYQGDMYMGWANGTPSGWGLNNSDGHPNIYEADGTKSKDWIVTNDGSYQAGDITFPGTAWGDNSKTMWHAHMAAFQYGGKWYGFNGGDPTQNSESTKGQNIARFYLQNGRMPRDGDNINIGDYNSDGYLQNHGGKTGVVIRYIGTTPAASSSGPMVAGATVSGGTAEEQTYRYLTSRGMTGIGAAGMMGCFKYESAFRTNNLEDTFQAKWGYPSGVAGDVQYTNDVNSGRESEYNFVHSRGTGRSGYGMSQFTASNLKQDLYNRTVKRGISIDDLPSQLDAIINTVQNSRVGSDSLYSKINNAPNPTEANKWFLWRYEAGSSYNSDEAVAKAYPWMGMTGINNRHSAAEQYYSMYRGGGEDDSFIPFDEIEMMMEEPSMIIDMPEYESPVVIDNDYLTSVIDTEDQFPEYVMDPIYGPFEVPEIIPYDAYEDGIFDDEALMAMSADAGNPYSNMPIPALPVDLQTSVPEAPIIVNRYADDYEPLVLEEYVGQVLSNEYDIESSRIKELVDQIFTELPEYLEDDDDEFSEEDDLVIQQLASMMM